jgi:tRNA-2-methylthio-N6-dimethylallyladenosine synthase
LWENGYREITLLGQNVDSYLWSGGGLKKEIYSQEELDSAVNFAQLLEKVALAVPQMRIRFSTSHPKDMTDQVLEVMARYENICKYIHLPVQSGNSRVLELMNRQYTREWYFDRIAAIRGIIPDCGISTDIISGFCTETEGEHADTLSLMENVQYDFAYMFSYSERPKTLAERKYKDDVPESVKSRRLKEVVATQLVCSAEKTALQVGKIHKVLIEGDSKKSSAQWMGRNPLPEATKSNKAFSASGLISFQLANTINASYLAKVCGFKSDKSSV